MTSRERLDRAWLALESRGAVVRRVDVSFLSDRECAALAEHAEKRLRAIAEGVDAGWFPGVGW